MLASRLVFVGNDNHVSAFEAVGITGAPLTSAASVARCYESNLDHSVNVLFAFANMDRASIGNGSNDVQQSIENALDAFEVPLPPVACGPALPKDFRLKPADLVNEFAAGVDVVVGRNDSRFALTVPPFWHQVFECQAER